MLAGEILLAGKILVVINVAWLFVNLSLTLGHYKQKKKHNQLFQEFMKESERIREQAVSLLTQARLQEYKVCPSCQRIIQGVCSTCHPVPSNIQ